MDENKKEDVATKSNVVSESLLFVTENDTFDVTVRFNEIDGVLSVEKVDSGFVVNEKTQEIIVTLKYPCQGDYEAIGKTFEKGFLSNDFNVKDFMFLEIVRLLTLIRKWSLKKKLTNEAVMQMKPAVVKSMLQSIREKIGMDGIL